MAKFEKIIFTKHALDRLDLRIISKDMVIQAIQKPNKAYQQDNGNTKFICKVNGCKVHVVCKPLPDENAWLVKSAWVRGEDNNGNQVRYKSYRAEKSGSNALSKAFTLIILVILAIWYYFNR